MSRDIFIFGNWVVAGVVLLASSEWRPRTLLTSYKAQDRPHNKEYPITRIKSVEIEKPWTKVSTSLFFLQYLCWGNQICGPCSGPCSSHHCGTIQHIPMSSEFSCEVTVWSPYVFSRWILCLALLPTWAFSSVGACSVFSCVLVLAANLPHRQGMPVGSTAWTPLSQERHFSRAQTLLVASFGLPVHPSPRGPVILQLNKQNIYPFVVLNLTLRRLTFNTDANSQSRFQELKLFLIKLALEAFRKLQFMQLACCPSKFPKSLEAEIWYTCPTQCPPPLILKSGSHHPKGWWQSRDKSREQDPCMVRKTAQGPAV